MTAIITTTHERTIFGNKEGEDWFEDLTSPEEDHRLENPMECEDCGDKENPIAWEGKIKCPTCWATDEEIVLECGWCSVEIKRNSREHDNCKTADGEVWYCEDCDIPEQPIVEDEN